jgi:hypothetical protein
MGAVFSHSNQTVYTVFGRGSRFTLAYANRRNQRCGDPGDCLTYRRSGGHLEGRVNLGRADSIGRCRIGRCGSVGRRCRSPQKRWALMGVVAVGVTAIDETTRSTHRSTALSRRLDPEDLREVTAALPRRTGRRHRLYPRWVSCF